MTRDPLRTIALVEVLTKGEFRALEWAVNRAKRNSEAFGSKSVNGMRAVRKLKEHLGSPSAESSLLAASEQQGLVWAVERATRDADGYPSEAAAARSAISKLNATANFERRARLAGHRDWARQIEERKADGDDICVNALHSAQDALGRKLRPPRATSRLRNTGRRSHRTDAGDREKPAASCSRS